MVGPVDLNQSVASVASSPSNASVDDSFKKELSDLKDEWSTRFARIEALLTMGSNPNSAQPISTVGNIAPVFSPVKVKVNHPPPTGVLSSSPFLPHTVSFVGFPPEDWFCQKFKQMNLYIIDGHVSRSGERGWLRTDQFLKVTKTQNRW